MSQKSESSKSKCKNVEERISHPRPRNIPRNSQIFGNHQTSSINTKLDEKCVYEFPDPLISIEYPGQIKNIDKALHTLGGLKAIQKAIDGESKLELKFHPDSQYSKGCIADKEQSFGLLVKVKPIPGSDECNYEIINASTLSFKFNKMCDFQYVPLITDDERENKNSEVRFAHHEIIPKEIPKMSWLTNKSTKEMPLALTPATFFKFDKSQMHFQSDSIETFLSLVRPDSKYGFLIKEKRKDFNCYAYRLAAVKPGIEIPTMPNPLAVQKMKERRRSEHCLNKLIALFNERPIWRKIAILHVTGLKEDIIKHGLPCVAYYSIGYPWNTCWIKLGYNPIQDINSRIYQTIDFRIRSNGMQLKVKSRRALWKLSQVHLSTVSENQYVLKPGTLPQARQMHYQYCDIHLPEIKEMFSKLPKYQDISNYDIKNGWLPINFTEQCREIMNKYILEAVQKELLLETNINKQSEQLNNTDEIGSSSSKNIVSVYCNKILSNISKDRTAANTENVEEIDLVQDNDEDDQVNADEIVNNLPECMSDGSEDESDTENLDTDILNELFMKKEDTDTIEDISID